MPPAALSANKGKLALSLRILGQSTAASRSVQRAISQKDGGDGRDRTDDLMLAKQLLSQLSYVP